MSTDTVVGKNLQFGVGVPLGIRRRGEAEVAIFPLPLPVPERRPSKGRALERWRRREFRWHWMCVVVATLNASYGCREPSLLQPSCAQLRLLARLECEMSEFLREAVQVDLGGERFLNQFIGSNLAWYGAGAHVLPLDERAGLPDAAATCDPEELIGPDTSLGQLVRDPSAFLLSDEKLPEQLPRAFVRVGPGYLQVVQAAVRVGLQQWRPRAFLHHFKGKPVISGVFAVAKPETKETRMISAAVPANTLLDKDLMPRPRFPNVSRLSTLLVPHRCRLVVSKRDVRHFYHRIKASLPWQRLLAHPPPMTTGTRRKINKAKMFPVHAAWPMGFAPSATVAQGVADYCAQAAGIDETTRLTDKEPAPRGCPVTGVMMDDVWAIDVVDGSTDLKALPGAQWVDKVSAEWEKVGLEENMKKREEATAGAEVQGMFVDPVTHTMGVSVEKRITLWAAGLLVLTSPRPCLRSIERMVGKLGYCMSARTCCRAVFSEMYRRIQKDRDAERARFSLDCGTFAEAMSALTLLPLMTMNFENAFSSLVVCSDAAPGGHGISYGRATCDEVQDWCRLASSKGGYTMLQWNGDPALLPEAGGHLERVHLPLQGRWWTHIGRPGGYRHITLEEARALTWAVEYRIKCRDELNKRCVHPVDNAAVCGSASKGRSPARALNAEVRKLMACQLLAGLLCHFPWVASADNPADIPSGWHGLRAGEAVPLGAALSAEERALVKTRVPMTIPRGSRFIFVHLFRNTGFHDEVAAQLERTLVDAPFAVEVVDLDRDKRADDNLLKKKVWDWLHDVALSGHLVAVWARLPTRAFKYVPGGRASEKQIHRDKPLVAEKLFVQRFSALIDVLPRGASFGVMGPTNLGAFTHPVWEEPPLRRLDLDFVDILLEDPAAETLKYVRLAGPIGDLQSCGLKRNLAVHDLGAVRPRSRSCEYRVCGELSSLLGEVGRQIARTLLSNYGGGHLQLPLAGARLAGRTTRRRNSGAVQQSEGPLREVDHDARHGRAGHAADDVGRRGGQVRLGTEGGRRRRLDASGVSGLDGVAADQGAVQASSDPSGHAGLGEGTATGASRGHAEARRLCHGDGARISSS